MDVQIDTFSNGMGSLETRQERNLWPTVDMKFLQRTTICISYQGSQSRVQHQNCNLNKCILCWFFSCYSLLLSNVQTFYTNFAIVRFHFRHRPQILGLSIRRMVEWQGILLVCARTFQNKGHQSWLSTLSPPTLNLSLSELCRCL